MAWTSRAALLALTLSGCGGAAAGSTAAPPPAEPPAQPAGEPTLEIEAAGTPAEATVDEAALAFERAEDQLDTLLAAATGAAEPVGRDRTGNKTPSGPTPSPRPPWTQAIEQSEEQAASACSRACQALDSMSRSSERLCTLTGEDDPRCENVRERLTRAREAVRRSCRQCEG